MVYRVELDEGEIIQALLSAGVLSETQALRPRSIELALNEVLSTWASRWTS